MEFHRKNKKIRSKLQNLISDSFLHQIGRSCTRSGWNWINNLYWASYLCFVMPDLAISHLKVLTCRWKSRTTSSNQKSAADILLFKLLVGRNPLDYGRNKPLWTVKRWKNTNNLPKFRWDRLMEMPKKYLSVFRLDSIRSSVWINNLMLDIVSRRVSNLWGNELGNR